MKKIAILLFLCIIFTSCGEDKDISIIGGADGPTAITTGERKMYINITPDEAKHIMDSGEEYVLLDVREQNEYDEGHIPGAILIPYTEIEEKAESMIPDKNKQILVYCRSGRRSKIASEALLKLGYTDIKEFGGIIDWKYEIEK
ncbi:MAG: rhodanese-like domain-containing protein [Ruminococcaceae bacterium]|nr:rhodanese-like domain-containing protein [Oscillospiraceae bacterium]